MHHHENDFEKHSGQDHDHNAPESTADSISPVSNPTPNHASTEAPNFNSHAPVQTSQFFCGMCGYDLTGLPIGNTCPECGHPVNASLRAQIMPTSGDATACMVLGIVCVSMCTIGCMCGVGPLLGIPCGIVSLMMHRKAKEMIQSGQFHSKSESMNSAGMVCSYVGLSFGLVWVAGIGISFFFE